MLLIGFLFCLVNRCFLLFVLAVFASYYYRETQYKGGSFNTPLKSPMWGKVIKVELGA